MPLSFTRREGTPRLAYERRGGSRWACHEIEALLLHLEARTSIRVVALRLGRSEEAVRCMARRLVGSVAMSHVAVADADDAPHEGA